MYDIFVGFVSVDPDQEPICFSKALGGLYDKDREMFQVKDDAGDTVYFPRENVTYFKIAKSTEPFDGDNIEELFKEKNNDLG